jgi:prepilin-type processing-associated H-X9-DG protein
LVVIAIIAVLAALLIPALSRAKEAGRTTVCKNNLRQWGMGMRMYLDDFQVYPPYSMNDFEGTTSQRSWHDRLERYTGGTLWSDDPRAYPPYQPRKVGVELCPSYAYLGGYGPDFEHIGSYGYNSSGFWREETQSLGLGGDLIRHPPHPEDRWPSKFRLVQESDVLCPSDMIAIGDSMIWAVTSEPGAIRMFRPMGIDILSGPDYGVLYVLGLVTDFPGGDAHKTLITRWTEARHNGRFNILFCDGHVEKLTVKQLFDPRDNNVVKRWNRDNQPHRNTIDGRY